MRSNPASFRPPVPFTVAGHPPRFSTQRRISSWSTVAFDSPAMFPPSAHLRDCHDAALATSSLLFSTSWPEFETVHLQARALLHEVVRGELPSLPSAIWISVFSTFSTLMPNAIVEAKPDLKQG